MLQLRELVAGYAGVKAIHGITVDVSLGESVAIVGPNGAGKTTMLKAISGTVDVYGGSITFDGASLTSLSAPERVELGIVHVPQGRMIFKRMTVLDNLRLGSYRRDAAKRFEERLALVYATFPLLEEFQNRHGGELSGGQQQMLALGRGVMACPRLLMLDEPSEGLAPVISEQIFAAIRTLIAGGDLAVLVVEQRAPEALEICERAYVLESGEVIMSGPAERLLNDPELAAAYFGAEP